VRGLAKNQELVESIYTQAGDQFQSHGETHAAEEFIASSNVRLRA
jgi:hypothetical protein